LTHIIVQILDILRFSATLWGLGATYTVHLRLIGKLVVDFLFVIIELFAPGVTAEARYERISSRSSRTVSLRQLSVLHWTN